MLFLFTMLIAPAGPAQAKYAAIVVDAETGRVLFERNADTRNYPASLTKMMTLYMVFDAVERGRLSMNQRLKVSRRAAGQAPSRLGLKAGSTITVREAVLALVTKSANDVATVVAEALGDGKESTFARRMTDKAKTLGMSRTQFRNASGLPNRRQKSTARDMARLAVALQRDFPQYYKFFSAQRFSWKKRTYVNHNRLLADYTGTDGIKTGYTRASGFNLVASTKRNSTRLIGVVFGGKTSKTRNKHMVHIMNLGFKRANDPARLASAKVMSLPNGTYALSKRFRQVPLPAMRPASATTVAVITPKTRPAAVKPVAAAAAGFEADGRRYRDDGVRQSTCAQADHRWRLGRTGRRVFSPSGSRGAADQAQHSLPAPVQRRRRHGRQGRASWRRVLSRPVPRPERARRARCLPRAGRQPHGLRRRAADRSSPAQPSAQRLTARTSRAAIAADLAMTGVERTIHTAEPAHRKLLLEFPGASARAAVTTPMATGQQQRQTCER